MKKLFSIGLGLFAGILLCYGIGYIFTTSSTVSASSNRTRQFGGNRSFGSGSSMMSGVLSSGNFMKGRRNGTGNFSGAIQETKKNRIDTTGSAESIITKDLPQQ